MVDGVRDGDSRDPWDAFAHDTRVRAGRAQASAHERLARTAGDHALLGRGATGGPLVPVPRPRRRLARATATALLVLVAAACAAVWTSSTPGAPLGRPATGSGECV